MSTSRDIEKLFDQFGGNASGYQEIGRENEAQVARDGWPLLSTLGVAPLAIPPVTPRNPDETPAAPVPNSPRPAAAQAGASPVVAGKPSLFARLRGQAISPAVPPVAEVRPMAPRFAARPQALEAAEAAARLQPAPVGAPPAVAPVAVAAPALRIPSAAETWAIPPVAAPAPVAVAAPAAAPARSTASLFTSAAPSVAAAPKAPSILGKLFAPPAAAVTRTPEPAAPASLHTIFTRLRDTSPAAAGSSDPTHPTSDAV